MAVGGALEQRGDQGKWELLAFFSRKLDAPQARYSAFNRELLAAHSAVRQVRYYLEGRKFTIFTDHKPLTFAQSKVADALSGRQQRQLAAIAEYTVDLRHVAGQDNVVADALLRAAVSAVKVGVNFHKLAAAQQADQDELLACQTDITGLKLPRFHCWGRSCRGNPQRSCLTSRWPGRGRSCHQARSGGRFLTRCMDSVTPESKQCRRWWVHVTSGMDCVGMWLSGQSSASRASAQRSQHTSRRRWRSTRHPRDGSRMSTSTWLGQWH
jgi:hypothetical protein